MAFPADFRVSLLVGAVMELRKRATLARSGLRDFSMAARNPSGQGDTVNVTTISRPTISSMTAAAVPSSMTSPTTNNVAININQWEGADFWLTDAQRHNQTTQFYSEIGQVHGQALADHIERFLYERIHDGNEYNAHCSAPADDDAVLDKDNAVATFIDARKALSKRDALGGELRAFVTPDAAAALLLTDHFSAADVRGDSMTGQTGDLGTKFGMRFMESNNIYTFDPSGVALINNSAGYTDVSTVKVDGVTAGNLKTGVVMKSATAGEYHVVLDGTSGASHNTLPVSGKLTGTNNASMDLKKPQTNWVMNPRALGFVMRPPNPLDDAGWHIGQHSVSFRDPETGFVMSLEEYRGHLATGFYFTALYGATVVHPELCQRVSARDEI